jgi:hypothetical protein
MSSLQNSPAASADIEVSRIIHYFDSKIQPYTFYEIKDLRLCVRDVLRRL